MKSFYMLFGLASLIFCASAGAPKKSPTTRWKEMETLLRGKQSERLAANQRLRAQGLKIIQGHEDLLALRKAGILVRLPRQVNSSTIPGYRQLATPAVVAYLREIVAQTGVRVTIKSAARSIQDQRQIAAGNNNAAPTRGPLVSAHLYGAAVDIRYLHMSVDDRVKVAEKLLRDKRAGRIQVALERKRQHCFHVVVFNSKAAVSRVGQKTKEKKKK